MAGAALGSTRADGLEPQRKKPALEPLADVEAGLSADRLCGVHRPQLLYPLGVDRDAAEQRPRPTAHAGPAAVWHNRDPLRAGRLTTATTVLVERQGMDVDVRLGYGTNDGGEMFVVTPGARMKPAPPPPPPPPPNMMAPWPLGPPSLPVRLEVPAEPVFGSGGTTLRWLLTSITLCASMVIMDVDSKMSGLAP